jgi:hypothetical protein
MAENAAIIVDLGGKDIKAGYASGWPTEEEPRLVRLRRQKIVFFTHQLKI